MGIGGARAFRQPQPRGDHNGHVAVVAAAAVVDRLRVVAPILIAPPPDRTGAGFVIGIRLLFTHAALTCT